MSLTKFNGTLINQFDSGVYGNAAVGRKVGVYLAGTDIKAELTDRLGNVIDNPVTTGSRGEYSFWIESGFYDLSLDEGAIDKNGNDISQKVTFQPIYPVGADTAELIDIPAFTGKTFTMPKTVTGLILFMNGRLLPESEYTFNQQLQVVTLVNVTSTLSDSFTVMVDSGNIGVSGGGNTYYFVSVTDARVQSGFNPGDIVRTGGYYTEVDGGDGRYAVRAAGYPVLPVAFKDHVLPSGGYLDLIQTNGQVVAAQWGVNKSQAQNADALQACVNYSKGYDSGKGIILPDGDIFIEKTVSWSEFFKMQGQGVYSTRIHSNGDYTVFEGYGTIDVADFYVINDAGEGQGNTSGIAFGSLRTDTPNNQISYSSFKNVNCYYYDFSWWLRASIWVNWKNCFSRSTVGIRFARNANPYDVTSAAPAGWNIFSPVLGWFHNLSRIDNCIMTDYEVGIWGSCMGSVIHATTQDQRGNKAQNKILPVTLERTGVYLEGNLGSQAEGNTITYLYTEGTDVPIRATDVKYVTVDNFFIQGGAEGDKYHSVVVASNATVNITSVSGSSFFNHKCILSNNAVVNGNISASVFGDFYIADATSRWNKGGLHEQFYDKTTFTVAGTGTPGSTVDFLVPDGITNAKNNSTFRVTVTGIYNGANMYVGEWIVRFLNTSNTFVSKVHYENNSGPASEWVTFQWAGGYAPYFTASSEFSNQFEVLVERIGDLRSFSADY